MFFHVYSPESSKRAVIILSFDSFNWRYVEIQMGLR